MTARLRRPAPWFAPAVLGFGVIAALAAGVTAYQWTLRSEMQVLSEQAMEIALLQSESLNGTLDKYRLIPPLLTKSSDIADVLLHGDTDRDGANRMAGAVAAYSAARDIMFVDQSGQVRGAARAERRGTDVGAQIWFREAMQGRLGRQFTTGADRNPSYIFAFAVRDQDHAIGVMAIDVWLEKIEATWSLARDPILVTDRFGTILIGNRPEWRGLPMTLKENAVFAARDDGSVLTLAADRQLQSYVHVGRNLPLLGWTMNVLLDREPALIAARLAGLLSGFVLMLLAAVGFLLAKRMEMRSSQARRDRASALRLERVVRDRTAALKKAQNDLVQSAKLAAIGQMAATLSHEYNQPLGALQAQSDNALAYLERNDHDGLRRALGQIGDLVRRMSALSRALRGFARKPGSALSPVGLAEVMAEVLVIIGPRARNEGVEIRSDLDGTIAVQGGRVRLSQVFVNLIANAMDAFQSSGQTDGRVIIDVRVDGDDVVVTIEDNGPGMDKATRAQVFDPFFTTKPQGKGLGLGLSIVASIMQDLGGRITVEPAETGGTRFDIRLNRAALPASDKAA